MNIKGQLNKRNHWLISLLSLATIIHTSYLTMAAICADNVFKDDTKDGPIKNRKKRIKEMDEVIKKDLE